MEDSKNKQIKYEQLNDNDVNDRDTKQNYLRTEILESN